MASSTLIAWTSATFNPWLGCTRCSPGCAHCYAADLTKNRMGLDLWGPSAPRQVTSDANWRKPLQWNREAQAAGERRRVFCASLADVFEDHPTANATRPRLWELIRRTPWLDWQILTKRPERIADNLPADWRDGWGNCWMGTSIESNAYAWRADHLRKIPATVRFVSYEPALGPLDELDLSGIDWLIYGAESGARRRPDDTQWARDMRARCEAAGVAYFFKQAGHRFTERLIHLDGQIVRQSPTPRLAAPGLPVEPVWITRASAVDGAPDRTAIK